MSDVRLHRAYRTPSWGCRDSARFLFGGSIVLRPLFKGSGQSSYLDRISKFSPCAMCFDVTDCPGIYVGILECPSDHLGLGNGIGNGVAIGLATVIDCRRLDYPIDMIAVSLSLSQWLEQDSSHALTRDIAIGSHPKALAASLT